VLYSVRSERMLMEQIQYNMLFRWFVGLAIDAAVWVPKLHFCQGQFSPRRRHWPIGLGLPLLLSISH
jgi:hypothetical protein